MHRRAPQQLPPLQQRQQQQPGQQQQRRQRGQRRGLWMPDPVQRQRQRQQQQKSRDACLSVCVKQQRLQRGPQPQQRQWLGPPPPLLRPREHQLPHLRLLNLLQLQ